MLTAGAALIEGIAVYVWIRGASPLIVAAVAVFGGAGLLIAHSIIERRLSARN
jgi:HAMP domain-containing protein